MVWEVFCGFLGLEGLQFVTRGKFGELTKLGSSTPPNSESFQENSWTIMKISPKGRSKPEKPNPTPSSKFPHEKKLQLHVCVFQFIPKKRVYARNQKKVEINSKKPYEKVKEKNWTKKVFFFIPLNLTRICTVELNWL